MSNRCGPPCRPFTLQDVMILVAAAAVGSLGVRYRLFDPAGSLGMALQASLRPKSPGWLANDYEVAGFALMLSSVAVLVLRARRPRPSIPRVMRQPGTVACFMVVANTWLGDLNWVVARLAAGTPHEFRSVGEEIWSRLSPEFPDYRSSYLVVTAWVVLYLGRLARPEPGWVDRSGRVVGWAWIVWGIGGSFL